MKELTNRIRAIYSKDNNLKINIPDFQYFMERLMILNHMYPHKNIISTFRAWEHWVLSTFETEEEFFSTRNTVLNTLVEQIRNSEGYQRFNTQDMNVFSASIEENLPKNVDKNIFHNDNDRRFFVSIDMVNANFSSLACYDDTIFEGCKTYEDFGRKYSTLYYPLIEGKGTRQYIFGNLNPKRIQTLEKYIMGLLVEPLKKRMNDMNPLKCFTHDELIFDITHKVNDGAFQYVEDFDDFILNINLIINAINLSDKLIKKLPNFRISIYQLFRIGKYGYAQKSLFDGEITLKCVSSVDAPLIMRSILGETVQEQDKVFMYDQTRFAKLLDSSVFDVLKEVPQELCI